jgi:hypothetical protein
VTDVTRVNWNLLKAGPCIAQEGDKMSAKRSTILRKIPGLMAAQVSDGQWAIVSNDRRTSLTEIEANKIIAAYLAIDELSKSTI